MMGKQEYTLTKLGPGPAGNGHPGIYYRTDSRIQVEPDFDPDMDSKLRDGLLETARHLDVKGILEIEILPPS
jgi:hypothetical protein